ncbi:MAG: SpoIID/LytB domain-containing protein [Clostridia bacterium]|nr:SpoIID/LytB domain-containing protein [Clostridia bacterium]
MKKILFTLTLMLIMMISYITITSYAIDPKYETVKIGLFYSSTAKSQITLSSEQSFEVGYMDSNKFISQYTFTEPNLTLAYGTSGQVIVNGVGTNVTNSSFALKPVNGIVSVNGSNYRGGIEIIPDSNGTFTVVNFVNINDYIAGVVGKEMSPSWHIEALKSQAVCARSYTITTWRKHSSNGFNLCSTQHCQAYLGMSGETESTIRAASETRDQVVMYGQSVAETLYSSSSGGASAYSKNVWGSDVPYLTAVKDPYEAYVDNPKAHWEVDLSKSDIKNSLAKSSVDIGEITDMKVTGADEYGRTYEVTIYGTSDKYVLKNDRTRTFFGLNSQMYSIIPQGGEAVAQPLSVLSGTGQSTTDLFTLKGSKASGTMSDGFYIKSSGTTRHYVLQSANPDSWLLSGSGWGHGLGMSQYGAKGMAEQGFGYKDILMFYFPGTYVQ